MVPMNFTKADEYIDEVWGKVGTPERDAMEAQLQEDVHAYYVGEAIKKARIQQNLTQEELGEKIGVKRSQICKLENGRCSPTISTISRVFRALGITTATLDLGVGGKVALW
ncbi:MAG: helix-turn-helix transcriptional regulator [Bacteroidaceae bacterium]|nr:helix-turn-helix transcriptional regulator [Bacteroidaceae bacterium]